MSAVIEVLIGASGAAIASGTIAVRHARAVAKALRGEADHNGELVPVTVRVHD